MGNTVAGPSADEAKAATPSDEVTFASFNRQKTFNMKKDSGLFRKGMTLKANLAATLGSEIDHKEAVKLPAGEDLNEWMAINTFIFYELTVNICKSCETLCSKDSCPRMNAGKNVVYLWADGKKVKKPIELSAPDYIEHMFEWIFELMSDPAIFPPDDHSKFPKNFVKTIKTIYKRLFRVYAHIYHSHLEAVQNLGAEAHLNSTFKHLIYFILEFDLVETGELVPLRKLIKSLTDRDTGEEHTVSDP